MRCEFVSFCLQGDNKTLRADMSHDTGLKGRVRDVDGRETNRALH